MCRRPDTVRSPPCLLQIPPSAKFADKARKLAGSGGLYLLVNRQGKYWRCDYRHAGKRKTMALGVYPDVSLAQARERHAVARAVLGGGRSDGPAQAR